ncbi:MAG: MucR family transcriptional regulator [Proteobacteria bacterium]|nr:MucR family transcriptional regulator [Pseudomonadota bacterium]
MDKRLLLQMTADIVASHASMNELTQADLLGEIDQVYAKLAGLSGGIEGEAELTMEIVPAEAEKIKPAVPLDAAFGSDKVFCMVCGKGMKTLKRHLATAHDMKPGQYRKAFGIPAGTALVAREYSEARKRMAKDLNLAERLVEARAARGKKKKK